MHPEAEAGDDIGVSLSNILDVILRDPRKNLGYDRSSVDEYLQEATIPMPSLAAKLRVRLPRHVDMYNIQFSASMHL